MNDDQFFIKTTDGTTFCIYELTFDEESCKMTFGYAPTTSLSIDKEEYAPEVSNIVESLINNHLKELIECQ